MLIDNDHKGRLYRYGLFLKGKIVERCKFEMWEGDIIDLFEEFDNIYFNSNCLKESVIALKETIEEDESEMSSKEAFKNQIQNLSDEISETLEILKSCVQKKEP
jgi:hypothetical protein